MKKCIFIICLIVALGGGELRAQRQGFVIDSPRRMGMGGAGVALSGPDNAIFMNPAILSTIERNRVEILDFQAIINQNTFHQYGFYRDHQDEFEGLDEMSDLEQNQFYNDLLDVARDQTVFGFAGMAPLTIVRPGFSFGIFERALLDYDLREGASAIPLLHADAVAEGEMILGFGTDLTTFFDRSLGVGANVKYLYRAVGQETRTAPAVETIDNVRFFRGWTMSFDLGLLLSGERWSFGAGIYDFNWPRITWKTDDDPPSGFRTPDETIAGSMRVGAAWEPQFGRLGLFDDFKFALDLESPFSEEMGFFNKISFGTEARFAGVMRVRTGFHQGYPTAGAGLVLKILKLEYAFYGESLGRHPGQVDSWNHMLSLGLGWGY